jgi:hypothetical protein
MRYRNIRQRNTEVSEGNTAYFFMTELDCFQMCKVLESLAVIGCVVTVSGAPGISSWGTK